MIAALPPKLEDLIDGLRWRIWRETLVGRLRLGTWTAAFVLVIAGVLHVAGIAQDRRFAAVAVLATIAVASIAGLARRLPVPAQASAEADRRFRANGLFAAAWEVSTLPPDRRPGAAALVLARAEDLAGRVSAAGPDTAKRRSAVAQWAPLAVAAIGGMLLAFHDASIPPPSGSVPMAASDAAKQPPALGSVIAALERAGAATSVAQKTPRPVAEGRSTSSATSARMSDEPGDGKTGGAAPTERGDNSSLAANSTPAGATADGGPQGASSGSGGLAPGAAGRGLSRPGQTESAGAPGSAQRVVLARRSGGSGPGVAPLAPATDIPVPWEVHGRVAAGDAVPWSADWAPALNRYVMTVIERTAADR
jgi:hypothetical protein